MKTKKSTAITIGISAVLITAVIWFLQGINGGSWMGNTWCAHHMMGGSMGFLMIVFWIVLIFGFIMLVSSLIKGPGLSSKNNEDPEVPLEILKRRYARGEIDQNEYNQKRGDLLD